MSAPGKSDEKFMYFENINLRLAKLAFIVSSFIIGLSVFLKPYDFYLYSGMGTHSLVRKELLPLLICRDPYKEHLICKETDSFLQDWKSHFEVYNKVQDFVQRNEIPISLPECKTDPSLMPQKDLEKKSQTLSAIKSADSMVYISDFKKQYLSQGGQSYERMISYFQVCLSRTDPHFFIPAVGHFTRKENAFHFK